jgi:DNA repair protein RadC
LSLGDKRRRGPGTPSEGDERLLGQLLGLAGAKEDAVHQARALIGRTGSLAAAVATPPSTLRAWGLGEDAVAALSLARRTVKASLRRTLDPRRRIDSGVRAIDYLHNELAHLTTEQFRILYLNNRFRLVLDEVHSEGTIGTAPVYTREVVKRALEVGAVHLILAHNHPSGDPTPSREHIAITRELNAALKLIGGSVLDHIVVGASGHVSLRDARML